MSDKSWMKHSSLYQSLDGWKKVFMGKEKILYPRGSIIIKQGIPIERLLYIFEGTVEYSKVDEEGNEVLIDVLGANNLFMIAPLFTGTPPLGSLIAVEDTVAASISIKEIKSLMKSDFRLTEELIYDLSMKSNCQVNRIQKHHTYKVDDRIIETLCALVEQQGMRLFINQEDLAKLADTTRVTVSKVFRDLKSLKIIRPIYGGIIIQDYRRLKQWHK